MSTLKVNRIEPRTGDSVEIVGLDIPEPTESPVKAWVNFNGTGTVAIRDSMNVSSITDNGVGNYTVNFSTAMPDTNYSAVGSCSIGSPDTYPLVVMVNTNISSNASPTTTQFRVTTRISNTQRDATWVNCVVIR